MAVLVRVTNLFHNGVHKEHSPGVVHVGYQDTHVIGYTIGGVQVLLSPEVPMYPLTVVVNLDEGTIKV